MGDGKPRNPAGGQQREIIQRVNQAYDEQCACHGQKHLLGS
jgi:hypothetical protein